MSTVPYPDTELVLLQAFVSMGFVTESRSGTWTPPGLQQALPYVRVSRYGGGDDGVTDRGAVDIDAFAATRAGARGLADQIADWLAAGPHRVGSVVIDQVAVDLRPVQRPWDNPNVRRFGITCTVSARRTA